jgi:hypothetical protein
MTGPLGMLKPCDYRNVPPHRKLSLRLCAGPRIVGDARDQEFGEARLIDLGKRYIAFTAADFLVAIGKQVSAFSGGTFQDDFTLVVVAVK